MNIKSLLLGSAAAMAVVSGAQAADAIVAAEPEALEYVRVCDAFGKGYFYIPGTETCLKIGGYVRTQLTVKENAFGRDGKGDYDAQSKGYLTFAAKNDTELGVVSGYINLEADDNGVKNDGSWINVAGFDVGYFYDWFDDGINGETDELGSPKTLQNSVRYTYDGGAFTAGVSVDELTGGYTLKSNDDIGVGGKLGFTAGSVSGWVIGNYDFDADEAAFKALLAAGFGPGTLQVAGVYATNPSYYWNASKWTVAASYELKATEKFTITPAAQYWGDYGISEFGNFKGPDAWKVGVTAGYQITDGLRSLATVNYKKVDDNGGDQWTGFLRLQRDF
ncbi:hypothetical protein BJF93_17310 [Xaviernesmea oryzae]|uniref:Porin n=1 Tax=Xaviernesmea oryzae TaxID=464029 RepID=A0A1Q9AT95_9HYPH|nr:porin [Xaviernesmea oryzae]OLP58606.1 hypothetical protein BJF93_17310 [Xaviernesmea oryzae]SEK63841.1 Porin subfamily protein [Xaviernesmea oryzae]